MKKLFSLVVAVVVFESGATLANPVAKDDCPGAKCTLRWYGNINRENVDATLKDGWLKDVKRLQIYSHGGEGIAAIRLANEIIEREIDVEVDMICHSACANYIFVAGKNKNIPAGAIVTWHGGAESVRLQQMLAERERALQSATESKDSALVAKIAGSIKAIHLSIEMQRQFYAKLGIDERVTRLGELRLESAIARWTIPLSEFSLYGIHSVNGSKDYGAPGYHTSLTLVGNMKHTVISYAEISK
jgi:hypothetical protein